MKKLPLRRETLRALRVVELAQARGGFESVDKGCPVAAAQPAATTDCPSG